MGWVSPFGAHLLDKLIYVEVKGHKFGVFFIRITDVKSFVSLEGGFDRPQMLTT